MLMHGRTRRSLLLHKSIEKVDFRAVFRCITLALFCFDVLHRRTQMISIDILVPGRPDISTSHRKQLLNHGGKLARIHHVVDEFTKCSGCLPFILIVDNYIFFTFRRLVCCVAHLFARRPFRFLFRRQTQVRRA